MLKIERARKATDTHLGKGDVHLPVYFRGSCEGNRNMAQLKCSPSFVSQRKNKPTVGGDRKSKNGGFWGTTEIVKKLEQDPSQCPQ